MELTMTQAGLATVVLALALIASPARADMSDMPGMGHAPPPAAGGTTPATRAYQAAMARMHAAMDVPATGNADIDFAAGMIPHHQGAIDMAEVELTYGHDPAMRRLARGIIAAQRREIALMHRWLTAHGAQ